MREGCRDRWSDEGRRRKGTYRWSEQGRIKKGRKEVSVPEYLCTIGEGRGVRLPQTVLGHRQSISGVSVTPGNHYHGRKKDLVQHTQDLHMCMVGMCVCACM